MSIGTPTQAQSQPWWKQLEPGTWKAFFAAWIGVLLDGYDFVLISFALPEITKYMGLSLVQGAALISAAFISRWIGGLVLGAIGDKYGRKPSMVLSMVLFAGASVCMAISPNFGLLFLFRLILGFAMAGEYASSATYVIESWPKNMRNKASGFLLSGYAVGVILAAQVDKYLVPAVDSWHDGWGWRALFLTGLAPVIVAIYMRRRLPEAKDWEAARAKSSTKAASAIAEQNVFQLLFHGPRKLINTALAVVAAVLLLLIFGTTVLSGAMVGVVSIIVAAIFVSLIVQFNPKRWVIGVAVMLTIFASFMYTWPIQGLLPTYLGDVGFSPGTVANIVAFAGLGNAIGYIVAGFLGDAIGMRRWYATSLIISQIIVFPLFFSGTTSTILVAIMLFFNQMFGQGISGLAPKWVSSYFPVEQRAAGLGFTYNIGALGGAVGPLIGATLASDYSLGAALGVLSVGFAVVVILSIGLNLPRKLQTLVNHDAVRPEDGNDEIIATA